MSTKYPTDFDDGVTLGPTFIDVVPPTDPQRDIAAEFRNNGRDAVIAVQTRVGKTDDPSTASVDWGMLSVSGAPNQGLRFAGDHALWPGLVAEDGIFIDSGTGNVSYHKAGDAVGVFTDLTGGGAIPTWDDLLATSQTMDLDVDAPLTWTQSDVSGYGFILQKTVATAAAALMKIETTNGTFDTSVPLVEVKRANSGLAMEVYGDINFSAISTGTSKITSDAPFEISTGATNDSLSILTTGASSGITLQTTVSTSPIAIFSSGTCQLTADTSNSSANLTISSGGNTTVNCGHHLLVNVVTGGYDMSLSVPTDAGSDIFFSAHGSGGIPFNALAPDNALIGFTATSVIGALNEVKADVPTWDAIYAVDKSLNVNGLPLKIYGVAPNVSNTFVVERNLAATTGPLVAMYNQNAGDLKPALEVATFSTSAAAVSTLTLSAPPGTLSVTESGFSPSAALGASADVSMFKAYMGDDVGDNAAATYRGFYAEVLSAAGPAKKYGFSADGNWGYGLHSESRVYLTDGASSTNPVLELDQGTAGLPFTDYIGTEAASQSASISSVQGDGGTVVGPQNKSSVGWQFEKMVKVNINGSDVYICAYTPAP